MTRWSRIRTSFWFLPGLLCLVAVVLAEVLIAVDQRLDGNDLGPFAFLATRIGESGSRDVLGAIASSVLGVAATSFSITIAVLATASSTYGPRLVRNFMADRGNQLVLGVYCATFLFSLLALRSIREPGGADEVFVPHLAVNVAVLLAVASIGMLVWFINHIADSVQIFTLSRQVRTDLVGVIDRLYPEEIGHGPDDVRGAAGPPDVPAGLESDGALVPATAPGYVQGVTEDDLLALATAHDLVISLRVRPGSHLVEGTTVAILWPPAHVDDRVVDAVRACLPSERSRTPHQDVDFAVLVLEEMAVRAMSPSTNDPYTAINALDDLAVALTRLARRRVPSPYRYDDAGRLRVVAPRTDLVELLGRVFDAVRLYAVDHPTVMRRAVELAEQVGTASATEEIRGCLRTHVDRLLEAFDRSSPQECDLTELRRRVGSTRAVLGRGTVAPGDLEPDGRRPAGAPTSGSSPTGPGA